jgi:hypothetical protein
LVVVVTYFDVRYPLPPETNVNPVTTPDAAVTLNTAPVAEPV